MRPQPLPWQGTGRQLRAGEAGMRKSQSGGRAEEGMAAAGSWRPGRAEDTGAGEEGRQRIGGKPLRQIAGALGAQRKWRRWRQRPGCRMTRCRGIRWRGTGIHEAIGHIPVSGQGGRSPGQRWRERWPRHARHAATDARPLPRPMTAERGVIHPDKQPRDACVLRRAALRQVFSLPGPRVRCHDCGSGASDRDACAWLRTPARARPCRGISAAVRGSVR